MIVETRKGLQAIRAITLHAMKRIDLINGRLTCRCDTDNAAAGANLAHRARPQQAHRPGENAVKPRKRIPIVFLPSPPSGNPSPLPQAPWEEEVENSERDNALFEILSIHEDLPTALRAGKVIRRIKSSPAGLPIEVNCWNLQAARNPAWRQMAAADARRAAMVLLSLHGFGELEQLIRAHLNSWLGQPRMRPCALVLSLDAEAKGARLVDSILQCVRAAAAAFGAEMFVHFEDPPAGGAFAAP